MIMFMARRNKKSFCSRTCDVQMLQEEVVVFSNEYGGVAKVKHTTRNAQIGGIS